MKENVIELKNIFKDYMILHENINVLKGINYNFEKGKLYAIKGHSGSGKTTLIKILGLLDSATSGDYKLLGMETNKLNDEKLSFYRMKHIGFIFQDYNLHPYMTAFENIMLPLIINDDIKPSEREKIINERLKEVNLLDRKNHFPRQLSGGEQQRVAIARALINNPSIIIADEPTGNLDKDNEKVIFALLKSFAKDGKCVIVVSHSDDISKYADVNLLLEDGKLKEVKNDK